MLTPRQDRRIRRGIRAQACLMWLMVVPVICGLIVAAVFLVLVT